MVRDKNENFLRDVLALISTIVSLVFTTCMLMTLGVTQFDKILYFFCGIVNDGAKWFALITAIKYFKAKVYGVFSFYLILFVLFFSVSLFASISFTAYTVQSQLYDVTESENLEYNTLTEHIKTLESEIAKLENEKTAEISRANKELDSIPLDYVTRRKEIEAKKNEVNIKYDEKLNNTKWQLSESKTKLTQTSDIKTEVKTLKKNPVAGLFNLMANVFNASLDSTIITCSVILGMILDVIGISFTVDKSNSYDSKRELNKQQTKNKNIYKLSRRLNNPAADSIDLRHSPAADSIDSLDSFLDYCNKNELDLNDLKFSEVEGLIPKSTFYKYKASMD